MQEYYTIEEVCEKLKVKRDFLYKEMRSGKLKYCTVGSHRRFTSAMIDDYIIENNKNKSCMVSLEPVPMPEVE